MSRTPLELPNFNIDQRAQYISDLWITYYSQKREWTEDKKELRNYIFATDTRKTTNQQLPWKNSTTLPKLCQIRDNLHSNYISALFPNDDWLSWEGYSKADSVRGKVEAIQAYMANKTRESDYRQTIDKALYDYIDTGNSFGIVSYVDSFVENDEEEKTNTYTGPKTTRISPHDIVFNPLAESFEDSFKVIRSVLSIGQLVDKAKSDADFVNVEQVLKFRKQALTGKGPFSMEEADKLEGLTIDGFGSYTEYLQSGYVEILEFYGDIFDRETMEHRTGRIITIMDRMHILRDIPFPSWLGKAPIVHCGWRTRSDNLWAMGPLDNLVGLQYRVDHLENLKADAMDLAVLPPLKIKGEVEEFEYGPLSRIHIDENGDVEELAKNAQWVIQANNEINYLTTLMEQFAGAPSEAMGIRTPGEKTKYEVQSLENAAGRIFQEKVTNFEINYIEKSLNMMLEAAKRNFDGNDVGKVMDEDLGVQRFIEITKDDITASGKLRPIGARHFAAQAQLVQNLTQLYNSQVGQMILPHTSGKELSKLIEEVMNVKRYSLYKPNVAIFEQQELQRLANQAQEDLNTEQGLTTQPQGIPPQ